MVARLEANIFDFVQIVHWKWCIFCAQQANATGGCNPRSEVCEFLNYLLILVNDDGKLNELREFDLIDIATCGVGSVMLAKRWQSPRMIVLSCSSLGGILNDEEFQRSLEYIEAFRALRGHTTEKLTTEKSINKAKVEGKPNSAVSKEKGKWTISVR